MLVIYPDGTSHESASINSTLSHGRGTNDSGGKNTQTNKRELHGQPLLPAEWEGIESPNAMMPEIFICFLVPAKMPIWKSVFASKFDARKDNESGAS